MGNLDCPGDLDMKGFQYLVVLDNFGAVCRSIHKFMILSCKLTCLFLDILLVCIFIQVLKRRTIKVFILESLFLVGNSS